MLRKDVTFWLSKKAKQDIEKVPLNIARKIYRWINSIQLIGLQETRRTVGFHDEPLKGKRINERSVRLNRSYRLIYMEDSTNSKILIQIIEVNKHDY